MSMANPLDFKFKRRTKYLYKYIEDYKGVSKNQIELGKTRKFSPQKSKIRPKKLLMFAGN